MSEHLGYHELQAVERISELQRESAHDRLLMRLPRRASAWRRGVRRFGQTLIMIGKRLERVEQNEQTIAYGS